MHHDVHLGAVSLRSQRCAMGGIPSHTELLETIPHVIIRPGGARRSASPLDGHKFPAPSLQPTARACQSRYHRYHRTPSVSGCSSLCAMRALSCAQQALLCAWAGVGRAQGSQVHCETVGVARACLPRGVLLELGDVAHRQFLTMRYATNISLFHRKRAFGAQLMRRMRGGFHHQGDESTRKCLGKSYER